MVRYAQIDKEEGIFLLYLGLLLLAGILQGIMVSLNGQMGNYFSLFGICFFVHAIALVLLFAYLLAEAPEGLPYPGAKPQKILDVENRALTAQVLEILERVTPVSKRRVQKTYGAL